MQILVAGGTGFVGQNLIPTLLKNYDVTVVGRDPYKIRKIFGDSVRAVSWQNLYTLSSEQYQAAIQLAGENLAAKRWSDNFKRKILDSRIYATETLVNWCMNSDHYKPHFYSASAISFYGLQSAKKQSELITEKDLRQGKDFLSHVSHAWEAAAKRPGLATTFLRFGVILQKNQGILKQLALPYSLGLGSFIGNGSQIISWVHIQDVINAIIFLLEHPDACGPVNIVSPESVSQKDFAKNLAAVMHRPLFLQIPVFLVKLLFGQMGKELLLGSQNVYPERLQKLGFQFAYKNIKTALSKEFLSKNIGI